MKSAIWNDHQVTSWSGLIGSPKKESHIYDQQNFVPITWQFVYHTVVSWPICVSIHEQPRLKCQIRGPPWNRLAQEHNLEHSYAFQTLYYWVISSSPFILVITGPWSIAMTIHIGAAHLFRGNDFIIDDFLATKSVGTMVWSPNVGKYKILYLYLIWKIFWPIKVFWTCSNLFSYV